MAFSAHSAAGPLLLGTHKQFCHDSVLPCLYLLPWLCALPGAHPAYLDTNEVIRGISLFPLQISLAAGLLLCILISFSIASPVRTGRPQLLQGPGSFLMPSCPLLTPPGLSPYSWSLGYFFLADLVLFLAKISLQGSILVTCAHLPSQYLLWPLEF